MPVLPLAVYMGSVDGGFENEGIWTDRFLRRCFGTGVWVTTLIFPHGFHITAAAHPSTWDLLILINSRVTTPLILRHLGTKKTRTSVNHGLVSIRPIIWRLLIHIPMILQPAVARSSQSSKKAIAFDSIVHVNIFDCDFCLFIFIYVCLFIDWQKVFTFPLFAQKTYNLSILLSISTRTSCFFFFFFFFTHAWYSSPTWPKEIVLTIKTTFHGKVATRNGKGNMPGSETYCGFNTHCPPLPSVLFVKVQM